MAKNKPSPKLPINQTGFATVLRNLAAIHRQRAQRFEAGSRRDKELVRATLLERKADEIEASA